jgi:hypothetical protein
MSDIKYNKRDDHWQLVFMYRYVIATEDDVRNQLS